MIRKFVIDRKIWLRGEGQDSFLLRESDKKMCCLGIYLHKCGVPKEELHGVSLPKQLLSLPKQAKWLKGSLRTHEFVNVNDSRQLTAEKREKRIAELFKDAGIEVKFEG